MEAIIDVIFDEISKNPVKGQVASYIPELHKVDPGKFGVYLTTVEGNSFGAGDAQERFSIQSIGKVIALCIAFERLGNQIWKRVGVEPSGAAFNSLVQLEYENGIPRNPLINAGAIVVCDILLSEMEDPREEIIRFLKGVCGSPTINYNVKVAASERSEGYRNMALINFMKSFGNIRNDVDKVLDLYFDLSSIEMSCAELSRSFVFLANRGRCSLSNQLILNEAQTKRINAIMQTCGFYDEAGEFAYRVGLPGKSGVGGGIVAVLPGQYAVCVWSPPLNPKGNSSRGIAFLEELTSVTNSTIF
ncbi:UNVERIFIED_CONTAM: hypothetical protein GTU68_038071 [Idotea baltica]|nr:hypothetical protein [Idotea baltica]